ncbi:hypothetical protein Q3G72_025471 [Acer saccharum]|nr:hypothetical protein Q3G72_025471 [Acer saccharum]
MSMLCSLPLASGLSPLFPPRLDIVLSGDYTPTSSSMSPCDSNRFTSISRKNDRKEGSGLSLKFSFLELHFTPLALNTFCIQLFLSHGVSATRWLALLQTMSNTTKTRYQYRF